MFDKFLYYLQCCVFGAYLFIFGNAEATQAQYDPNCEFAHDAEVPYNASNYVYPCVDEVESNDPDGGYSPEKDMVESGLYYADEEQDNRPYCTIIAPPDFLFSTQSILAVIYSSREELPDNYDMSYVPCNFDYQILSDGTQKLTVFHSHIHTILDKIEEEISNNPGKLSRKISEDHKIPACFKNFYGEQVTALWIWARSRTHGGPFNRYLVPFRTPSEEMIIKLFLVDNSVEGKKIQIERISDPIFSEMYEHCPCPTD